MTVAKPEGLPHVPRAPFTREAPDVRRAALIEATGRVLAAKGAAGASVRAICAEAGVSAGLLRHYFEGVDALVAAAYAATGARIDAALEAAVVAAGETPRKRLSAYLTASFAPPVLDPDLLATWLAFWSLVKVDPAVAAIHRRTYAGYRARLEALLSACDPKIDARLAAIGLTAVVDGLWLELCLDATVFSPAEAGAIAERLAAGYLN